MSLKLIFYFSYSTLCIRGVDSFLKLGGGGASNNEAPSILPKSGAGGNYPHPLIDAPVYYYARGGSVIVKYWDTTNGLVYKHLYSFNVTFDR